LGCPVRERPIKIGLTWRPHGQFMEWRRDVLKKDSEPRRQFLEWLVPSAVRAQLGVQDGSECSITLALAGYSHKRSYVLTSGGEFRVPKSVADRLHGLAAVHPTSQIVFEIQADRSLDSVEREFARRLKAASKLSSEERNQRLHLAAKLAQKVQVTTTIFLRNQLVVAEVLARAGGFCESCHSAAPFSRAADGSPYLEVHHEKRLADGGEDTIQNAVALCPNCHRKRHFG
jgi:5-methylcytosine-specific restriction endonuclease McrA